MLLHWNPADASRVDELVAQLTLDEKITLLGGVDGFYMRGIERLGIPKIRMTDGPNGTRVFGKSTAYPAGVLLAATWDPSLAEREGEQLGRDARARGAHVLLAPGMNIYRHPRNGRNFEYFGEDPLLCGEIAAGYVRGVQSQGVSAVIKHFIANNQETDRFNVSVDADERTFRELYLPAFKRAIDAARPGAVMCSYNRINGVYAAADRWLLTEVLRQEWKFDGIIMSDWGAVHGTLGTVNAGLDLEMPGPTWLNAGRIKPLIESGQVSPATIDEKVRRLLAWQERFGWLDHDITDASIPLDNPDGAAVALEVARAGLTLLKNDDNLLPLDPAKVRSVVVLGANAIETPVGGGGSGYTEPFRSTSIAAGLQAAFGQEKVHVLLGDPHAKLAAAPAVDGGVFRAEYFRNTALEGPPLIAREERTIKFDGWPDDDREVVPGVKGGKFSARYRATITPAQDVDYTFFTHADDGSRVILDGKPVLDDWSDHQARTRSVTVKLEAGKAHDLVVEYYDAGGAATLTFGCGPMPKPFDDAELRQLSTADAVIVCVGFGPQYEGEGSDRTYALPPGQEDLIRRALDSNPRTLVILNAGGGVDMGGWIDRSAGLLHAYYAGQEGGTAIAEVLSGKVNPSGRLPFTIERRLEDVPSADNFGHDKLTEYAEGIFVGYRGFDRRDVEPRFPFGFGLSYTSFALGETSARLEGDTILVSTEVTNAGGREGASVIQCYVEPPPGAAPRPVRELRAFAKVTIKAGEKESIELRIPRSDLAFWDVNAHAWRVEPGEYRVRVGFDSRDLPGSAGVALE